MKLEFIGYIEEISSDISFSRSTKEIQNWLDQYKEEFKTAIETSLCRKWNKRVKSNERPFPCVCQTREKD